MKSILIAVIAFFWLNNVEAQTHNPGPNSNCKLNKNVWLNSEKMSCPACTKIRKKEETAKAAEDKRRVDVLVAKAKAGKETADKAYRDKLAEKAKSAKAAGKVYVDESKNAGTKTQTQPKINSNSKFMTNSTGCAFEDSLRNVILQTPGCYHTRVISQLSFLKKPEKALYQYGWVQFNDAEKKATVGYTCNDDMHYGNVDLVDYTGKRQFNNRYLYRIDHINDGWFMLEIDSSDIYYKHDYCDQLYNIFTKKTIRLKRNWDWGTFYIGYCDKFNYDCDRYGPINHFIPIFADSVKLNTGYSHYGHSSTNLKKMLLKFHPNILTEQMIAENSIVLFVTGSISAWYGYETDFPKRKSRTGNSESGYSGGYHGLLLISKDGSVKKIDL